MIIFNIVIIKIKSKFIILTGESLYVNEDIICVFKINFIHN